MTKETFWKCYKQLLILAATIHPDVYCIEFDESIEKMAEDIADKCERLAVGHKSSLKRINTNNVIFTTLFSLIFPGETFSHEKLETFYKGLKYEWEGKPCPPWEL